MLTFVYLQKELNAYVHSEYDSSYAASCCPTALECGPAPMYTIPIITRQHMSTYSRVSIVPKCVHTSRTLTVCIPANLSGPLADRLQPNPFLTIFSLPSFLRLSVSLVRALGGLAACSSRLAYATCICCCFASSWAGALQAS